LSGRRLLIHSSCGEIMFRIHSRTLLVCAVLLPVFSAAADPGDPSADVPALEYRSTLDNYRRHAVEPVGSWRSANDIVGRQAAMHDHGTHGSGAHDPGVQGEVDPHAGHDAHRPIRTRVTEHLTGRQLSVRNRAGTCTLTRSPVRRRRRRTHRMRARITHIRRAAEACSMAPPARTVR
jgi:hypothetical protein